MKVFDVTRTEVRRFGKDRIKLCFEDGEGNKIEIAVSEGGGEEIVIVAELFGDGNLSIVRGDGKVHTCMRTVRLHSRTVAAGREFEFPPSRIDPFALDYNLFVELMNASESDLVRSLATQINFGGRYAEEICLRSSVDKECLISNAVQSDYERIGAPIPHL